MKHYILSSDTEASLKIAAEALRDAGLADIGPISAHADTITPAVPDPQNPLVPLTPAVMGPVYHRMTLRTADNAVLPALGEGVTVRDATETEIASLFPVYVPPRVVPPQPVETAVQRIPNISDRQFAHGLYKSNLITFEEAKAWTARGDLPAAVTAFLNTMPEHLRNDVDLILSGASVFERDNPLAEQFGQALGMTPEQLDQFWLGCASL